MPQPSWICLCSDVDLYWMRTEIWRIPELIQLLSVKSIRRNLPPKGTAGLDLTLVKGCSLSPVPPAIIITDTLSIWTTTCDTTTVKLRLFFFNYIKLEFPVLTISYRSFEVFI
jgi:hypothetical protein